MKWPKYLPSPSYAASVVLAGVTATLPLAAGAASSTATTTVNATINSTITVTSSGTVNLPITPTTTGSQTTASDTVSVSTNNTTGYQLRISDSDTTTTLANGGNTITAHTGTYAAPTALAANTWGYRVDVTGNIGASSGFGAGPTSASTDQAANTSLFAGVPSSATPQTIRTTSSTAASEVTTVWYSAEATTARPNGTYTGQVTYTAITN